MSKIPVGVLGATGIVGQQYIQLLANHPFFEIGFLASSEPSAGKTYQEAIKGRWHLPTSIPSHIAKICVCSVADIPTASKMCNFVFSALTTEAALMHEEKYAAANIPVISNASTHRLAKDIPLLIPEINADHLAIIPQQQKNRQWDKGFIIVKPNCSIQSYVIPLAPLHDEFKIKRLIVTTMQATSGAGYPGIPSLNIIDNIIPYIANEEEKSEIEPLKIFGSIQNNTIVHASNIAISSHCNRVPVLDGHMVCVSVQFEQKPKVNTILDRWHAFQGKLQKGLLPSSPPQLIVYKEELDRPQPRLDRDTGSGMAITVGRLRECPVFDYRFVALSHNTRRGAAAGGILNAELLFKQRYLKTSG